MRRLYTLLLVLWGAPIALFAQNEAIRLNQVGYYPSSVKKAVVIGTSATAFELKKLDGTVAYSGTVGAPQRWSASGEDVQEIDFTGFEDAGEYVISVAGVGESYSFQISGNALAEAGRKSVRYFYYNRVSMDIVEPYAEGYPHKGAHWDTDVQVCEDKNYPNGTANGSSWSSPGGWYDAGDYNKYIQTAGISTYTLLSAYEQYPQYVSALNLNIPESNNAIPDLIDECLYEIDWMLTAQDIDGGVFAKVTDQKFTAFVLPEKSDGTGGGRYICRKNSPSTLQFAATMAAAYRILEPIDSELPLGYRDTLLSAAKRAWQWAKQFSVNASGCPCSITTGGYGDSNFSDEWIWAACELYLATADEGYYTDQRQNILSIDEFFTPDWGGNKEVLGVISLLLNKNKLAGSVQGDVTQLSNLLKNKADSYYAEYEANPYRIIKGDAWGWGSNGDAGNQSFVIFSAHTVFGDDKYAEAGLSNMDYILGKNPTSYSWLTGVGDKTVYNAHHRISGGDGIDEPVPGMVFGGSYQQVTNFKLENWVGSEEYAMTEVTINWNAPVAFSLLASQALYGATCPELSLGQDFSLCPDDVAFPVTLQSGAENVPLTWLHNGDVIVGQTGTSLVFADFQQDIEGEYEVLYSGNGCYVSDKIVISNSLPTPHLEASASTADGPVILDSHTSGTYDYQWFRDGDFIPGADSTSLLVTDLMHWYTVHIRSNACGQVVDSIFVSNGQQPYNDVFAQIPGVVEFEEYDVETITGAAFSDSDPTNRGGELRTDAVDVEECDAGGYNIGYTVDGEWQEYSVSVQQSGIYSVVFSIATQGNVGAFHLEVDGVDVTGSVAAASSGSTGWQIWGTIEVANIALARGNSVLRFVVDEGGFNYNNMTFTLTAPVAETQTVSLDAGWNLVVLTVVPDNASISELFPSATVVKDLEGYYRVNQASYLNSISHIVPGKPYLINVPDNVSVDITGDLYEFPSANALHDGWNLIAVPAGKNASVADLPDAVTAVKDFDAYQKLPDNTGNLTQLKGGNAYYIYSAGPATITW